MKSSSLLDNKVSLLPQIKGHWNTVKQWLPQTPGRALEEAYQAALKITSLENDYFNGEQVCVNTNQAISYKMSLLRSEFNKHFLTVKLRWAEFQLSHSVIGSLNPVDLEKVKYINYVLNKYNPENELSPLVRLLNQVKNGQIFSQNQSHGVTIDIQANDYTSNQGSIMRTFNRVKTELEPKAEAEVVKNFRNSKKKTRIAVRFIVLLILVPLVTQQISKQFLVHPIVNNMRTGGESPDFINSEMKEEALKELHEYEEELKFESFLTKSPEISPEVRKEKVREKAAELVKEYHTKSNDAISNVFADLLGTVAFALLLLTSQKQVLILKEFLSGIITGLSDSVKAFTLILLTDMFVGFHSPHGWEVILEGLAAHLGLPASKTWISLFIATVPVVMDTVFKYWIFRYMTSLSPSAVATMKTMNE